MHADYLRSDPEDRNKKQAKDGDTQLTQKIKNFQREGYLMVIQTTQETTQTSVILWIRATTNLLDSAVNADLISPDN